MLKYFLETAVEKMSHLTHIFMKLVPFLLSTCVIWLTATEVSSQKTTRMSRMPLYFGKRLASPPVIERPAQRKPWSTSDSALISDESNLCLRSSSKHGPHPGENNPFTRFSVFTHDHSPKQESSTSDLNDLFVENKDTKDPEDLQYILFSKSLSQPRYLGSFNKNNREQIMPSIVEDNIMPGFKRSSLRRMPAFYGKRSMHNMRGEPKLPSSANDILTSQTGLHTAVPPASFKHKHNIMFIGDRNRGYGQVFNKNQPSENLNYVKYENVKIPGMMSQIEDKETFRNELKEELMPRFDLTNSGTMNWLEARIKDCVDWTYPLKQNKRYYFSKLERLPHFTTKRRDDHQHSSSRQFRSIELPSSYVFRVRDPRTAGLSTSWAAASMLSPFTEN